MTSVEKLAKIRHLAATHPSAHPAYHKHCHLHADDMCTNCQWLAELRRILDHD